jgi:hypothetical protein
MLTKCCALIPYRLQVKVKQKVFSTVLERDSSVSEGLKTIFRRRYGLPDFKFLLLFELGTCVQNIIFTKGVEGCQKNCFPQRGMLKFKYKGQFLHKKKGIEGNNILKIQTVRTWTLESSTYRIFFGKNTPKPQFLMVFLSSTCLLWKFCRWAVRELDKKMGTTCHVG